MGTPGTQAYWVAVRAGEEKLMRLLARAVEVSAREAAVVLFFF